MLCGNVSGVGRLCGREKWDYSGYSFKCGFRSSCGPALRAKQLADTLIHLWGAPNGKEVKAIARMWGRTLHVEI